MSRAVPGRPRRARVEGQRGAATMLIALFVLLGLAIIGMAGTRLVISQHRISANSARGDAAFAAADAAVQEAIVYAAANRSRMTDVHLNGWMDSSSSNKWRNCSNSDTALPCGSGTANLYNNSWSYYGPIPNQTPVNGVYSVSTWYLTDSLTDTDPDTPTLPCTNLALTAMVPTATGTLISTVNTLLGILHVGSLPTNLCLPLNFSEEPYSTGANVDNPSLMIVASAAPASDVAAGSAVVQQVIATTSLFYGPPCAALTVNGTVTLTGDIHIWGNPRPDITDNCDFALLELNNVAGVPVTATMNATVGSTVGSLAHDLNVSFAPTLNVNTSQVAAFDWNVTFPLSIWSANTTTLTAGAVGVNILNSARTCDPPWTGAANAACLPLSISVSIPAGSVAPLTPLVGVNLPLKLPDVQDPTNVVNTVTGLIGTTPPAFPSDLFAATFGYPTAQVSRVQGQATAVADCSSVAGGGFYWVSGDCSLSGNVGTANAPLVIVATGNVTLAAGTDFYGVIYLRGSGAHTITGSGSTPRPNIHGALLSEGALTGTSNFNLGYDHDAISVAGHLVGKFAPVPGGWNDAATGP